MLKKEKPKKPIDIIESKLGKTLGAENLAYREKVTIFIAHKDKDANEVPNIQDWIKKAEVVLSKIGGGATSLEVQGAWLGDRNLPIHETTTLVYSYLEPIAILKAVSKLKKFIYHYGKLTNQGEVAILLENPDGDWFFKIPESKFKM